MGFLAVIRQEDTHLYLCSVPGCDVRDGPASFLLDGLFGAVEEVEKGLKG